MEIGVSRFFSQRLWLFPVVAFCIAVGGIAIVYIIAVSRDDVDAFFPYISEAGSLPPESGIFGIVLTFTAIFLAICMVLRHRQVVALYGGRLNVRGHYWRPASQLTLALGFVSCTGILMVANFQASNELSVHMVGALMAFFVGLLYCWLQTIFGFVMKPRMAPNALLYLRLGLCLFGVFFFITMEVCGFMGRPAAAMAAGNATTNASTTTSGAAANEGGATVPAYRWGHWPHDDTGFPEHVVSAASEWLMVASFLLFMLTYAYELSGTRWRGGTIDFTPDGRWDVRTARSARPVAVAYLSTTSRPANLTIPATPTAPSLADSTAGASPHLVAPPTPTPSIGGGALRSPALFGGGGAQKHSFTYDNVLSVKRQSAHGVSPAPSPDAMFATSPDFDYLNSRHD